MSIRSRLVVAGAAAVAAFAGAAALAPALAPAQNRRAPEVEMTQEERTFNQPQLQSYCLLKAETAIRTLPGYELRGTGSTDSRFGVKPGTTLAIMCLDDQRHIVLSASTVNADTSGGILAVLVDAFDAADP